MTKNYTVGIDEVGRGPIAGPVAVGAVLLQPQIQNSKFKILKGVKDSKQLSEKQREEWFTQIQEWYKEGILDYRVTFVSPRIIDSIGIVPALHRALVGSLNGLEVEPEKTHVLLDGGLKAPDVWQNQETIIRGDASEPVIALASIVAKVLRDRKMVQYAKKYPEYGFEKHKGYGTRAHYVALKHYGVCPLHRLTFVHI